MQNSRSSEDPIYTSYGSLRSSGLGTPQHANISYSQRPQEKNASASKAIGEAFRALQEYNKHLESEKSSLELVVASLEEKISYERERWEAKFIDEISNQSNKENSLMEQMRSFESEMRDLRNKMTDNEDKNCDAENQIAMLQSENSKLSSQNQTLNTQIEDYENDFRSLKDQFTIEKDSWMMQMDMLQNKIASQAENDAYTENVAQKINQERDELKADLHDALESMAMLKAEFDNFKKFSEAEKGNLIQLNTEVIASRDYYLEQYKKIKEISKQQRVQIEKLEFDLKNNMHTLEQLHAEAKKFQMEKESRELFINDIVKVNDQLVQTLNAKSRKIRAKKRKVSTPESSAFMSARLTPTPSIDDEVDIRTRIVQLEGEVFSLNSTYEQLLSQTKTEGADLKRIRSELSNLTDAMQVKSDELQEARDRLKKLTK